MVQFSPPSADQEPVDRIALDQLMAEARIVASSHDPSTVVDRIDAELDGATDPWVVGSLQLIKSIALQCHAEPMRPADAARSAFESLRKTGDASRAAYAAAAGAVLLHRTGDIGRTVDLAVEAMILLPDADPVDADALSATNAMAQVFSQLSAFDLAGDMADRTFRNSAALPLTIRGHYAYAAAGCATDAGHAADPANRQRWIDLISDAADYLDTDTVSPLSPFIATGMRAEVALLTDDDGLFAAIESELVVDTGEDLDLYPHVGDRLVPWHRLVRAATARRWADPAVALDLLNLSIPELDTLGETSRFARALEERSRANVALGRPSAAIDDAFELARRSRALLTGQVGRLADQIAQRARVERNRNLLMQRADLLAKEAAVDALTGVGTRRSLEARFNQLAKTSGRLAVVIMDLDHFKRVNDSYGHTIGDQVLRIVGGLLRDRVRSRDVLARYGGEEFVVVLEHYRDADSLAVAERLHAGVAEQDWGELALGLSVTASAGVAFGPARLVRDVLRLADTALYEAKRQGRNRIEVGQRLDTEALDLVSRLSFP